MKNKGFFKISNEIIEMDWNVIQLIFKDFRPTHIEFRHWENDMWYYYGVSKLFEELKEGQLPPQYDIVFTRHDDNSLTYEFKKYS